MENNKDISYSFGIREMFRTRVSKGREQRTGQERRRARQDG